MSGIEIIGMITEGIMAGINMMIVIMPMVTIMIIKKDQNLKNRLLQMRSGHEKRAPGKLESSGIKLLCSGNENI